MLPGEPIGTMRGLKVGDSAHYDSDDPNIEVWLYRPNDQDVYALDMTAVPSPDEVKCGDALLEVEVGLGEGPSRIVSDCGEGKIYAQYDAYGNPAATNVPKAAQRLPAYKVLVMEDGTLVLLDRRVSPRDVRAMWGVQF